TTECLPSAAPSGRAADVLTFVLHTEWASNVSIAAPLSCLWSITDALYFVVATLSTVGYGDIIVSSEDNFGIQFVMLYAMTGMVVFATFSSLSTEAFASISAVISRRAYVERVPSDPTVLLFFHIFALVTFFFVLHVVSACIFVHLEGLR
ncbi:MAG: hypothetical protein SGPRY_007176, partial [Prymnesium sp.]